jgi:agmatine deiminase
MVEELTKHVPVRFVDQLGLSTDDAWVRDYGPLFVTTTQPPSLSCAGSPSECNTRLAAHDFRFNGWGAKYGPHEHDDRVARQIAAHLNIPCFEHGLVLEGGSIDVNGASAVLLCESCVLNENRNIGLTRAAFESQFHGALGTTHAIWLPGGSVQGDDTDGHVDNMARFIAPDTIAAVRAGETHPDHETHVANWGSLEDARDQDGKPFNLVPLPAPEPIYYDYPPDRFDAGGLLPLPVSYANFLITNGAVLVPVFGQGRDEQALSVLEQLFPGRRVVPVRCEHLAVGQGGVHCLTMQQPEGG